MKFSHSLQFNAVPEWSNEYIAYSSLKGLIYRLEKEGIKDNQDAENRVLLQSTTSAEAVFAQALDHELLKICVFFTQKANNLHIELRSILELDCQFQSKYEALLDDPNHPGLSRTRLNSQIAETNALTKASQDRAGSPDVSGRKGSVFPSWSRNSNRPESSGDRQLFPFTEEIQTFKRRVTVCFVSFCQLQSFAQLNLQGFTKALKKFDKTLGTNLRTSYLESKVRASQFLQSTVHAEIEAAIDTLVAIYARLITHNDIALAENELRGHLREQVVWERNTVWRDMINIERKAQAAQLSNTKVLFGSSLAEQVELKAAGAAKMLDKRGSLLVRLRTSRIEASNIILLGFICLIFICFLWIPSNAGSEEKNCLAILVLVSLLWATEVIPLFVTSLLIPFLLVVFRVARTEDHQHVRLDARDATRFFFATMWSPVIVLLLGGFAIAAALSKYHIAKLLATWVLSKAGTRPKWVLLANMFVAMFASMWISNVAAPILCYSIIQVCSDKSFILNIATVEKY